MSGSGAEAPSGGWIPPDPAVQPFFDPEGHLIIVPAKRAKRLLVLDRLAQLFEPGEHYPETEVNRRLRVAHDDVAMLRRYLVDEGFLDRAAGVYWRIGGSVDGV